VEFDLVVSYLAKVKVKRRKATDIAYIEHVGPYGGIPFDEYYSRLYAWAKKSKVRPGWKGMAIYPDDPKRVPEEKLRTEVAIPIIGEAQGSESVKVRRLPDMEVAIIVHSGPAEDYDKTYAELGAWIEQNGYEWASAPMEEYTKKPKIKDGKVIIRSNILAPVRKK
jgi:effector-binding domain-containing protein